MTTGCRPTSKNEREINRHIGERIRAGRTVRSWSLQRLGDAIGVDNTTIHKYERGSTRISVCRLLQIAECLDQPITFFTEGAPVVGCTEG